MSFILCLSFLIFLLSDGEKQIWQEVDWCWPYKEPKRGRKGSKSCWENSTKHSSFVLLGKFNNNLGIFLQLSSIQGKFNIDFLSHRKNSSFIFCPPVNCISQMIKVYFSDLARCISDQYDLAGEWLIRGMDWSLGGTENLSTPSSPGQFISTWQTHGLIEASLQTFQTLNESQTRFSYTWSN